MVLFYFIFFNKNLSFYFSLYFEGSLPAEGRSLGSYTVGEILLYFFYVPMFLRKDFLMGRIRKIQNSMRERMEKRKRRDGVTMKGFVPIILTL